jgi:nucleoid-associated protein YgaU
MEDKNNLDDLIGSSGGQPIIVQESGSDKKFLYTLLILLVVLFIIAIAVIAFLGSKYFGNNANSQNNSVEKVVIAPKKQDEVVKKAVEVVKQKKIVKEHVAKEQNSAKEQEVESNTLSELENLVKEEEAKKPEKKEEVVVKKQVEVNKPQTNEQKAIAKVASAATGGKTLSQEDLAKIAKLVAQELAKSNATNSKQTSKKVTNSDKDLVASLENVQADTLKSQNIDTTNLKDSNVNTTNNKKVDTFNKVVIKNQGGGDDELAKLSSEIDTILQSEEVTKEEKSLKYGKELKQDIARRKQELRFIVVKKGDTLSSLAYKAYGRGSAYKKIYAANPDLVKNPNRIYVGMRLRVPVDEEYIKQQQGN